MENEFGEKVYPPFLRLSPSEAEALIQAKLVEAKRQRLYEVRQQSRNLTLRIKQRKLENVAKVLARTKVTVVQQAEEQLERLRQEAEIFLLEEMSHFGEGHHKALAQPDLMASKELANASNKRLAKRRGAEAFQEMKVQKDLTQRKASAHIKARKAALQVEAVRAAYQASKPTPKTLLTQPKPPPLPKAVIFQYGSLYQSTFHPPVSIIETHSEDALCDPREAARQEEKLIAEKEKCQEEQRLLAKRRGAVALAYEKNAVQWRKRLHELEEEYEESLENSSDHENLTIEGATPVFSAAEEQQEPMEGEIPVPAKNDAIIELHPTHDSDSRTPLTSPGPENQMSSSLDEPTLDPELLNQLRDLLKKIPRRKIPSEGQNIPQRTSDEVQDIPRRKTLPDLQEIPQRDVTTFPSTSSVPHHSIPEQDVHSSDQPIQGNVESESSSSIEVSVKVIERFDNAIEKALYRKSFKTTSKENIPPLSQSSTKYRDLPRKLGKSDSAVNVSQSRFQTPSQSTRREILKRYIEKLLQSQREELVNLSKTTDSSLSVSSIHLGAEARDFPKPTTQSESLSSASPSGRGDQIDFQLIPRVPPFSKSWPSFASASSVTSVSSKQSSLPSLELTESTQTSVHSSQSKHGKVLSISSRGDARKLPKGSVSTAQSEDSLQARLRWLEEQVESKEEKSRPLPLSTLLKDFRRFPDSAEKRNQVYAELASLQSFSVSEASVKSKSVAESSTDISVPDVDAALRRLGMPALTAVLRR